MMKRITTNLIPIAALLMFGTAGQTHAGFLTFDETTALTPWNGGQLADGFSIPVLSATRGAATNVSDYALGPALSGQNAMFNFSAREGYLERSSAFDLAGAYFKNHGQFQGSSATFEAKGYNASGIVVYSNTLTVTGTKWQYLSLNMDGIFGFGFNPVTPDDHFMVMDDMEYFDSQPVPEPTSAVLWGLSALAACVFTRRHRQRQA